MNDKPQRSWRVGHQGRDRMFYEEHVEGSWQRIDIDGEMLMGREHHVIYFASSDQWQTYPAWARNRRNEIVARIKSEFRPPDYEYHEDAGASTTNSVRFPVKEKVTAKQYAALFLVILILVGITVSTGWLVVRGINSGETFMPSKHSSRQRTIHREKEPASYWAALGVYSLISLGGCCAVAWGIRMARRTIHISKR